jgi:hypothetical protein
MDVTKICGSGAPGIVFSLVHVRTKIGLRGVARLVWEGCSPQASCAWRSEVNDSMKIHWMTWESRFDVHMYRIPEDDVVLAN